MTSGADAIYSIMKSANRSNLLEKRVPPLSKLSIVIFTYERHDYVLRNMHYWSGTDVRVYVLDGSAKEIDARILEELKPNIVYRHLPVSVWLRIAAAPSMVDSEYVAFLADDEFFIPSALEACITALDDDEGLVACYGKGIGKSLANDLVVHRSVIFSEQSNYREGSSGVVDHSDPVTRMVSHMNPYSPSSFYAVCRSGPWKRAVQLFSSRQYSSGVLPEVQFELSMSFQGKIKSVNELMWIRSAENSSNVNGFELSFDAWFTDPHYIAEVAQFLDNTAQDLIATAEGKLGFNETRDGLERACNAYVAYCNKLAICSEVPSRSNSGGNAQPLCLKGFKAYVRKIASTLPEALVPILPDRLRFRSYENIVKALESNGLKINWIEFTKILKTVREFHDKKYRPLLD